MNRELRKILFEGVLEPDLLDKLVNVEGLGDDDYLDDDNEQNNQGQGRGSQDSSRRSNTDDRVKAVKNGHSQKPQDLSKDFDDESGNESESFQAHGLTSDEEEEEKTEDQFNQQRVSSKMSDISRGGETPRKKGRVQFQDNAPQRGGGYQGIDLQMLYQTKNEVIYKLSDIYLPRYHNQKQKMVEFNREKMVNQNEIENEAIRGKKRKIKEEIKQIQGKLKHQVVYANPGPLLDDAYYFYNPGMNTRQLSIMNERGKFSNAPHIGRILPQKRQISQAQIDQQKQQMQENLKNQKKEDENKIKSYLVSDKNDLGISTISILTDEDLKDLAVPEHKQKYDEFKKLESQYLEVIERINKEGISMADLNENQRLSIKEYLKIQASNFVNSKYPSIKMSNVDKQCYTFMKYLNAEDFSYKNQKSAIQSDDTGMFFDDFIGGGMSNNNHHSNNAHPIFGLNQERSQALTNMNTDEKLSVISDREHQNNQQQKPQNEKEVTDYQLQEWFIEQKYKTMQQYLPIKRKKYWGEPTDCSSLMQVQKDNYKYRQFQNMMYLQRGRKDEQIFKIEKDTKEQKQNGQVKQKSNGEEDKKVESLQVRDIKEYEYFKQQQSYFYKETDSKTSVNSIMRGIKFELGLIKEEEFYAQEALEEYLENQQFQGKGGQAKDQKERQLEIEQRKEKISNEIQDNFDIHYEKRKKELLDNLLKKIQQQEKANQQTSTSQQVQAYASGSHAVQLAQGSIDNKLDMNKDKSKGINMNKMRDDQEFGGDMHGNNLDEDMMDEAQANKNNLHEGIADDNQLRVTKSRANELNHAKCILKLTYTKFDWSEKALLNFHRPNIQEIFDEILYQAQVDLQEKQRTQQNKGTSFIFSGGQLRVKDVQENVQIPQRIDFSQVNVKVMANEYIEKRAKKIGIINAHDFFRDRYKLSLKEGKFCVFEHADQHPLFINNFGMASKLKRYVYSDKPLPHNAFTKKQENQKTRHMGPHGAQFLKKKGEKIPLLGQIDTNMIKGITVLENNMYHCPVFYHKPQRSDFLCIFHKEKSGKNQIFVRELSEIYTMGQEEPKVEVYNPQSRTYQHFIKKRTQAYVIRFLQENNNCVSFFELNKFFPYINDQILKKINKEINVEVDRNQCCSLTQEYNDEQFRALITPENICQYESAQFGEQMLKKVGIKDITNADKISYATNKFCSEEPDMKKQLIARIIEEEVLSTPWNLSQNFIHNRQQKGMMMLEGIGDPSNGHGGYSYLKLPLKISQDSLNKAKINRMYLNPAIQNPKAVTGTDADLRKLSKKEIKNKLIDLGFKEDSIANFTRWEMVALLRDRSSQAVSQGIEGDMKKFARGVRFTSKKQREMYQKQVNDIFKKQIGYLCRETSDFISDVSDSESRDQRQKKINDMQQMNNNYSKNIVELKEDINVKHISDIPNYEILLISNQPQLAGSQPGGVLNIGSNTGMQGYDLATGNIDKESAKEALRQRLASKETTLKCTILRKKIKPVNGDKDIIERVIYCSDPRQIKGFQKRMHKYQVKTKRTKKTSLKEKMQTSKPIMEEFKGGARSETSSVFRHGHSLNQGNLSTFAGQSRDRDAEPVKIKIGAGSIKENQNMQSDLYGQRPSSQVAINLGQSAKPQKKPQQQFQRYASQLSMSNVPYDQLSEDAHYFEQQRGGQGPQQKISINIPMQQQQQDEGSKKTLGEKKKTKPKKPTISKFAGTAYNDDDYESYKPKTQASRRRQQSEETMLNEIFANIIDSCIGFDQQKIFSYPVKRKEAPNYYDVIKNPIDLGSMRNKAKRGEYIGQQQFKEDLALLRSNAEYYNGPLSLLAQSARDLEQHALDKLNEVADDITNLEMLVREKNETIVKI